MRHVSRTVVAAVAVLGCSADASQGPGESKTPAVLSFTSLSAKYDGTTRPLAVTTDPPGLTGVTVSYAGSSTPPTNTGRYLVSASLNNPDYRASPITDTMVVLPGDVPIVRIIELNDSRFTEPVRLVIRSQAEWVAASANLFSHPATVRDFDRYMIIIAGRGAGWHSDASRVNVVSGSHTEAWMSFTVQYFGCSLAQPFRAPVDVVQVPRSDLPVMFVQAPNGSCG